MDRRHPPPPPPQQQPIFRHHHNHIRYENVLRPPNFLPPPPPPPLQPQSHPSTIHLPLPHHPPPPPPPLVPIRRSSPPLPHRFAPSPPRYPVIDRSYHREFDPPPKPYFQPALIPRESIPSRVIDDYSRRNPLFVDDIFHRDRIDDIRESPGNWDWNSRLCATVVHDRALDDDIDCCDQYRDVIPESFELHRGRDGGRSWDSGIGGDLDSRRDYNERRWNSGMNDGYNERRWNSGMNDGSLDLYRERDYDGRNWNSDMNERSRNLYREHDFSESSWDWELYRKGSFDDRRCDSQLYCQVDHNERRWDSNRSDGVLSRLGNRQPEFADDVPILGGVLSRLGHRQPVFAEDVPSPGGVLSRLGNRKPEFVEGGRSLGRFSGRLGTRDRNGEFNKSDKKKRSQKKNTLHRIQSGKVRSRHSGGFKSRPFAEDSNRGNFKGNGKGSGNVQTRLEGKRDREDSPVELAISFKSNALVARAIQVPSDPAVELCEKSNAAEKILECNVSASKDDTVSDLRTDSQGTPTSHQDEAADSESGSVAANNPKNAHMVASGETHSSCLRKRKRVTEQPFEDSLDNSVGTCKSFVPELKKEKSSLNTTPDSSYVSDNVITKSSDCADGWIITTEKADVRQSRANEIACHAHENLISNGDIESLVSNQHVNTNVHDRVDDVSKLSVSGEAELLESSFTEGDSEDIFHIEDHHTGVSSRYQETRVPEVENYFSETHELVLPLKSDYTVMQMTDDANVSDMDPKDADSEDVRPNRSSEPQFMLDANYFRSLEGPSVTDFSDVPVDISVSSHVLSGNEKALPEFDASFPKDEETGLSVENSSSKVIGDGGTCLTVDTLSKVVRKRKDRDDQLALSGRTAYMNVGTIRSIDDEVRRHSEKDISPAMGGLSKKDSSKEDTSLNEGPSERESLQEGYFNANGSFPGCQKKHRISSPRSSLSSLSEDDTVADGLSMHSTIPSEFGDEQSGDTSSPLTSINRCGTIDVEGDGVDSYVVNLVDGNKSGGDDLSLIARGISCSDRNSLSASNSGDEQLISGFDMQSCITSPEEIQVHSDLNFSGNTNTSACLSENEMICSSDNISKKEKSVIADPNTSCLGKYLEAGIAKSQTNAGIPQCPHKDTSQVVKKLYPVHGKHTWSKNQHPSAVPKVFHAQHPSVSNTRKLFSAHVTKSRTWCRTGNSTLPIAETKLRHSPSQISGTNAATSMQSSYIRKGNSLVRNPSPSHDTSSVFHGSSSSVYRLSPCTNIMKNTLTTDKTIGDADTPALKGTGKISTSEMTKVPSTNHNGNSSSCTPCNLEEPLSIRNPHNNVCSSKALDVMDERIKSPHVPEYQTDSVVNSDSQGTFGEGNSEKKIVYVKRRSYQLVAAPNSNDTSVSEVDNNQSQLSDGYYKSREHQLVRASSENPVKTVNAIANVPRVVPQSIVSKTSSKRQSGFSKTRRHSKFSFVWKLHDTESSQKHKHSLGPRKVLPYLFSYKRAAYRRSLVLGIKPQLSNMSQKMLISRKRGAIYTRSRHGYSLKMSKVLGVGGSSLKWSKSIDRNSKKANEDATRSVAAAAEKRKKEEKGAVPIASKTRNHVSRKWVLDVKLRPGERIFRIGSERYKMDASRRTLHRITEKESSSSVAVQSDKNVKRSYIPRRLLIGNEEYVRIGNGNQLVRDPKKRTRVLASEKVRWSLRTARLRLARKRKYCQFFTRFGKCNKDDGKCPYIHDPSKIVVCTKFLTGSCTNVNCKLTHKVIPERMQDCSYFLKGSCSNDNCPYRHVHINPESSVCESFLRGYCADGNECPKKHTYVCPDFEATGVCPQATTCKLHHPKKKAEKKPETEQRIVRGRYFDGGLLEAADCSAAPTEKLSSEGKDYTGAHEGKYPDYISLDVSEDEPDHRTLDSNETLPDDYR